jgi:hypothetical protein
VVASLLSKYEALSLSPNITKKQKERKKEKKMLCFTLISGTILALQMFSLNF